MKIALISDNHTFFLNKEDNSFAICMQGIDLNANSSQIINLKLKYHQSYVNIQTVNQETKYFRRNKTPIELRTKKCKK